MPLKSHMAESEARKTLMDWNPQPTGTCFAENKIELKYDLQIIVPAYNAEEYIGDCLRSIFSQKTHYKYQVTIVNDGSTDNTADMIDKLIKSQNDIPVRVITQPNRGLSGARNSGLSTIYGQYVMFIDSDDVIPPNAIENLLSAAYSTDTDILQGEWYNFPTPKTSKSAHAAKKSVLTNSSDILSGYPWGKLYKYSVMKYFIFPEGYWFEDTPISFILAAMPYKFSTTACVAYGYRLNPKGITQSSITSRKSIDSYWITEKCLEEFPQFGLFYDQRAYEYVLRQSIMTWGRTRKQPIKIQKAIFILTNSLLKKYFDDFRTQNKKMKAVETAIKNKQFVRYEILMRAI